MTRELQRPVRPVPPAAEQAGLHRIARGGVLNLAGALVSAVASLGLTIVVTQNFGKPEAGAFFVAMSLFLIVETVASLGAFNGAIFFIARVRALRAERRIPAILRAAIVPVVVASILAMTLVIIFATPLARLLLDGKAAPGVSPQAVASALRALAIALPFAALTDTLLGAARGFHEMRPTVVVDRIGRSGLQALGVAAATIAGSSALLAPLWAVPYLGACVVALIWLRRIIRRKRRPAAADQAAPAPPGASLAAQVPAPRAAMAADGLAVDNRHGKPNAKGFWRFTAPRSLASLAQIIIQRLDIVLVGILLGPVQAAIYTAATRFLVAGQLGNQAISMAAQPQFTKLFAVGDRTGANAVYQATTGWLILLTWPLYLLAVIFGPTVLAIFGHSYTAGNVVMLTLGLSMLVATACGQVDMVLITTGRSSWSLYNGLLAMAVNVGVDLAQVAKAAKVHPFGVGTAAACVLTTVSFGVIPLAIRLSAGTGAVAAFSSGAIGCVVMAAGMWRLRGPLQLSVIGRPGARHPL
jgi:O-antigen/teichoic acid export membrane protein